MILLDTNLLARVTDSRDPQSGTARHAVHELLSQREQLVIVGQNLYEFWVVATRRPGAAPAGQNGLGMTVEQASQWLGFFQRRFCLLPDHDDLPRRWYELVKTLGIRGYRAHGARLVAAMQCYGIASLLSFNFGDFQGLPVTIIDPAAV